MTLHAQLVVFEGPDGVGKSTLSDVVVRHLRAEGIPADGLSLPGAEPGTLGRHVYDLHHDPRRFGIEGIEPTSLQLLHAAAHIDQIHRQIRPHLEQGRWVVLDRFWWSTLVYGRCAGADERSLDLMRRLAEHHWAQAPPLVVFLVDRGGEHADEGRSELRRLYRELADQEAERVRVVPITNNGTLETAVDAVWQVLDPHVHPRRQTRCDEPSAALPPRAPQANGLEGPEVWVRMKPLKPTPVYDTYWRFAAARQDILFRRLEGQPPPWTDDTVLSRHRFTNAYRAADRVSQFLIRHVIYDGCWEPKDLVFRILLFKIFNKIETWQLLEQEVGPICWDGFDIRRYAETLRAARLQGRAIYSGAYIMASPGAAYGHRMKHENHLAMLQRMMQDDLALRIQDAGSLQDIYRTLRGYPSLGPFLAFQYSIDLNYSELIDFDEMSFVVPGPGARDGIAKCFADRGSLGEADVIRWVAERQQEEFDRLGLQFRRLGSRPLQLIDCQNLLCEVDKYARVYHPQSKGRSGRSRIKQVFAARPEPVTLWFPPKWRINHAFERTSQKSGISTHAGLFR